MRFKCTDCGRGYEHWKSVCEICGNGAIVIVNESSGHGATRNRLRKFSEIPARKYPRVSTSFDNLDKILGGGLVPGSVLLVTGEPGAGKSTLMLQTLGALVNTGLVGAMIHAEESADQLAARALYWEVPSRHFYMLPDRNIERAFQSLHDIKLDVLLADSLQTIHTPRLPETSIKQPVAVCNALVNFAQKKRCAVIIVGHVTKEGEMSGPQTLKHLVDVTLHLEFADFNSEGARRNITSIKNRYGPSPLTLPLILTAMGFRNE